MKSSLTVFAALVCGLFAFSVSADQGDDGAPSLSDGWCSEGEGAEDERAKAFEHYLNSAKKGRLSARLVLEALYHFTSSETEVSPWLRRAADRGESDAQRLLGECYLSGTRVERDYGEAVRRFRGSAEQGNPDGERLLGLCYFNGTGVEQDFGKAIHWFRKSALQGDQRAEGMLRYCYREKIGVKQDYAGMDWLFEHDCSYEFYVERSYEEAVKVCQDAAENGFPAAQWALGNCYRRGRGVEGDLSEAKRWYRKASAQGFKPAKKALMKFRLFKCLTWLVVAGAFYEAYRTLTRIAEENAEPEENRGRKGELPENG